MTSHKRGSNNGAVREENELSLTIEIAADHWLTEATLISLSLSLFHNLVFNY